MKRLPDAARRVHAATRAWLAVPFNAVLALVGASLLVTLLSLAFGDRLVGTQLYFPPFGGATGSLQGEYRELPRVAGIEARVGLIAEELLLGPMEPDHLAAFSPGIRVERVIVRKRVAWIDLTEAAALEPAAGLKTGIAALERSLRASLPALSRIVVTVGGREPWAELPEAAESAVAERGGAPKNEEKN